MCSVNLLLFQLNKQILNWIIIYLLELVFFTEARIVLCFSLVTDVLTNSEQGLHSINTFSVFPSVSTESRLGVGKSLGGTQLGQPTLTKRYSIIYNIMLNNKNRQEFFLVGHLSPNGDFVSLVIFWFFIPLLSWLYFDSQVLTF